VGDAVLSPLRVGDPAPDFTLPGTGGQSYHLAAQRGGPVVLVFYPADKSPVCTQQLRSYSEDLSSFGRLGAVVWCLSPQDVESHEAFAEAEGLTLPLLADVDKEIAEQYQILGPLGFYRRSVFVVDGEGIIRFVRRSLTSMTYVSAERLLEAVTASTTA
jgi:peroxiredoxin Q/BCP